MTVLLVSLAIVAALAIADSAAAGPMKFRVDKQGKLQLPGPVLFEKGKDKLLKESDPVLEHIKKFLEANPDVSLARVSAHTSIAGDAAENMDLSKRRAMAVSRWLVSKGINCVRLIPVGHGGTSPAVKPEKDAMDKATNARIEIVQVHLKGKPIPGISLTGDGIPAGDPCAK